MTSISDVNTKSFAAYKMRPKRLINDLMNDLKKITAVSLI